LRFSPILAARERTRGGTWRVACRPGVADALGRAFVLGTAVAEAVAEGAIELRTVADEPDVQRILFASPDRIDAVVGPEKDRTLVTEEAPKRVTPAGRAVRERFAAATPETVDMPARSRLLAAACETLDDRFADDVAAVLDALPYGAVGRTGEVTDRTLLVALAARHDHLLWDLRRWIGDGADGERRRRRDRRWTGPHRRPASPRAARPDRGDQDARGRRRPQLRLRAVDDALLRATPEEVLSVLRGRFRAPGRRGRAGPTAARPRRAATGLGADAT